jgi:hypothetical protein
LYFLCTGLLTFSPVNAMLPQVGLC